MHLLNNWDLYIKFRSHCFNRNGIHFSVVIYFVTCLTRQVLEMVASVAPEVFTDWKRQSAELHIARLFQVNH